MSVCVSVCLCVCLCRFSQSAPLLSCAAHGLEPRPAAAASCRAAVHCYDDDSDGGGGRRGSRGGQRGPRVAPAAPVLFMSVGLSVCLCVCLRRFSQSAPLLSCAKGPSARPRAERCRQPSSPAHALKGPAPSLVRTAAVASCSCAKGLSALPRAEQCSKNCVQVLRNLRATCDKKKHDIHPNISMCE